MTDVQKQAIKDVLHLIVDKEELPVLQDLAGKLPAQYAAIVQGLLAAAVPVAVSAEDKVIEAL